jgi:hypothetical protein
MANFRGILKHSLSFAIPGNSLYFSVTSVLSVADAISRLALGREARFRGDVVIGHGAV